MIRVCHVIHSLQEGGAEDLLIDIARAGGGYDLEAAVLSLLPLEERRVTVELQSRGTTVLSVDARTRWDPRALPRAVDMIRAISPDVVQTHLKHADIVGAYATRRLGLPMVSTLHLIEDEVGPLGRLKRMSAGIARNRTAAVTIAVSEAQRRWYVEAFRADADRIVTVRNGIAEPPSTSPAERAALRDALGVGSDDLVVTMVAMMRPGKGHRELLSAAAMLAPDAGVTFVLVGDGELRPELEAEARRRSLPAVFTGFRDDIPQLLAATDLVVHPSRADALPTALIRALAAGRPIVASDVGGIPEIVAPGTGILVPPGDADALASAIRELAADGARRVEMGACARQQYEAHFTNARWMSQLRDVYLCAMGPAE